VNLKDFRSWEKQSLNTFVKDGQPTIRMVEECSHYGPMITWFQIGEEEGTTGVPMLESKDYFLGLSESNNRIGNREFENGSVTYEFLWKPLGLSVPDEELEAFSKSRIKYTDLWLVKKLLKAKGYSQVD
jgi:hypothetical protein